MTQVESFKVDHRYLEPGVYLRKIHKLGRIFPKKIYTYDCRFVKPNTGFIKGSAMHTIEHCMAYYMRQTSISDHVIDVSIMGCLTGMYITTDSKVSRSKLLFALYEAIHKILSKVKKESDIPGMTLEQCGNYRYNNLNGAREALINYLYVIKKIEL